MKRSLYRYSSSRNNQRLLESGSVRVGTLYDFRKSEHKQGISDPEEGKKTVSHFIDNWESWNPETHNQLHNDAPSAFNIMKFPANSNFILRNVTFTQVIEDPDCFVHCTAHTLSKSVMDQFEGAESCVEIFDTQGFYSRLTQKLSLIVPVTLQIVATVTYSDRAEQWNGQDWGTAPCMIKGRDFTPQCEVRAVWTPDKKVAIEPQIIVDRKLRQYCRSVEV